MPFSIGPHSSKLLLAGLLMAGACTTGPESTRPAAPNPGNGFVRVTEWSAAERALRLARVENERYYRNRFPEQADRLTGWTSIPKDVRRRDTEFGPDWYFRFESDEGDWIELVVLASGGIKDLDAGTGS